MFHLKYFYDAALANSMTAAALRNNLTRPGVSQAIKSLEEQLGVQLIEHRKREFVVTNEGRWLVDQCQALFGQVDEIKSQMENLADKVVGQLKVGSSRSIASFLFPQAFSRLEQAHPRLQVSLALGVESDILHAVEARSIDIGFVLTDKPKANPSSTVVFKGEFICAGAKDLKTKNKFLVTENRPEVAALKRSVGELGISDSKYLEIQSWDLIRDFAIQGLGIALLPDFLLSTDRGKSLKAIPKLSLHTKYQVVAYYRQRTPAIRALLECIQR
jgi:DNA-binding transcriptional LysR family regulator